MHRCCQMNKDLTSQQSIYLDYSNIFRPKTTVFVTTKARLMHVAVVATIRGRFNAHGDWQNTKKERFEQLHTNNVG